MDEWEWMAGNDMMLVGNLEQILTATLKMVYDDWTVLDFAIQWDIFICASRKFTWIQQ